MTCATYPTSSGIITSRFGVRCGIRTGAPTFHAGDDLQGRPGDPVFAAADGVVERVFPNDGFTPMRGYGNVVVVRHPDLGVWTSYNHMLRSVVRAGDFVHKGQKIGEVGATTNGKFPGMGPHLHFEVRHAKPDGSSPFPGPYGRFNINPELWFDSLGIGFNGRRLYPVRGVPCILGARPEALARASRDVAVRCRLAGLDATGPIPWTEVTRGQEETEYEPPTQDDGSAVSGILAGAGTLIAAVLIARRQ